MSKQLNEVLPYYLGTGVKCQMKYGLDNVEFELNGIINDLALFTVDNNRFQVTIERPFEEVKLLLNPLSLLTEEIVVEGYNGGLPFVPIYEIAQKYYPHINGHSDEQFEPLIEEIENNEHLFCIGIDLISWGFNVFNLDPELWIDKSTLNK